MRPTPAGHSLTGRPALRTAGRNGTGPAAPVGRLAKVHRVPRGVPATRRHGGTSLRERRDWFAGFPVLFARRAVEPQLHGSAGQALPDGPLHGSARTLPPIGAEPSGSRRRTGGTLQSGLMFDP